MGNLKINQKGYTRGYIIHEATEHKYYVCRVLNSYDNFEEAQEDYVNVVCDDITDIDLLKEFSKKSIL